VRLGLCFLAALEIAVESPFEVGLAADTYGFGMAHLRGETVWPAWSSAAGSTGTS
jgi:hypothetical protein